MSTQRSYHARRTKKRGAARRWGQRRTPGCDPSIAAACMRQPDATGLDRRARLHGRSRAACGNNRRSWGDPREVACVLVLRSPVLVVDGRVTESVAVGRALERRVDLPRLFAHDVRHARPLLRDRREEQPLALVHRLRQHRERDHADPSAPTDRSRRSAALAGDGIDGIRRRYKIHRTFHDAPPIHTTSALRPDLPAPSVPFASTCGSNGSHVAPSCSQTITCPTRERHHAARSA